MSQRRCSRRRHHPGDPHRPSELPGIGEQVLDGAARRAVDRCRSSSPTATGDSATPAAAGTAIRTTSPTTPSSAPPDDTVAYSRTCLTACTQRAAPTFPSSCSNTSSATAPTRSLGVVGLISRSEENQADCYAGVTTAFRPYRPPAAFQRCARRPPNALRTRRHPHFGASSRPRPTRMAPRNSGWPPSAAATPRRIKACRTLGQSQTGKVGDPGSSAVP